MFKSSSSIDLFSPLSIYVVSTQRFLGEVGDDERCTFSQIIQNHLKFKLWHQRFFRLKTDTFDGIIEF